MNNINIISDNKEAKKNNKLILEEIKNNKDDKKMKEKIAKMKEDLLQPSKDNKNEKKPTKKKIIKKVTKKNNNIKKNASIKIQTLWRGYKIMKHVKKLHLAQRFINKISDVVNNKNKNLFNHFINQMKYIQKTFDSEKVKELIEKEKKYDILIVKYEEVLKELEKLKNELEHKKNIFSQKMNSIHNKNQNISINIFPTDSQIIKIRKKKIN